MFKYCKGWLEKSKYIMLFVYNMWGSKRCGKFKFIFLVFDLYKIVIKIGFFKWMCINKRNEF